MLQHIPSGNATNSALCKSLGGVVLDIGVIVLCQLQQAWADLFCDHRSIQLRRDGSKDLGDVEPNVRDGVTSQAQDSGEELSGHHILADALGQSLWEEGSG